MFTNNDTAAVADTAVLANSIADRLAESLAEPKRSGPPVPGDIVDGKVLKLLSDKGKPFAALVTFGSAVGMLRQRDICGNEVEQTERLQEFKRGDDIQVMVTKVDLKSHPARFDLSERLVNSFVRALELVGSQVVGRVTGVTKFGAFLDVGNGVSGVLFTSEMSSLDQRKRHEGLKIGDNINVVVLSAQRDERNPLAPRVSFSEIDAALQKAASLAGSIVTAKVVGPCNAGTRLLLDDGVEAVLTSEHLGGIAESSLKKGNNLKVKVLGISGRSLLVSREGIGGGTHARAVQDAKRAARRQKDQALRSSMQGSSGGGGGNKGGKGKK